MTYRFLLLAILPLFLLLPLNAAEDVLVGWQNPKLEDDGILEAVVNRHPGVTIEATPSFFSPALEATKDGVKSIKGNSVVLYAKSDRDERGQSIEDAVEKKQFAEVGFKVGGLADGSVLHVTGFSYDVRPNGQRAAQVAGAESSQAWINGSLAGHSVKHKTFDRGKNEVASLGIELRNGDAFAARVYFAGFDSEPGNDKPFTGYHRGIRFGNVVVKGKVTGESSQPLPRTDLPAKVSAVLMEHCYQCHGAEKQKGKVRFDTLSADFVHDAAAAETWHDAMDAIAIGEMPPEDEPELTPVEREALLGWIRGKIDEAVIALQGKAEGVVLRRMNKAEYRHTMTDLLGVPGEYGAKLPSDPLSEDGFANNGAALGMSALQLEYYLEAAREALDRILVEGPKPERVVTKAGDSAPVTDFRKSKESGKMLDRKRNFVLEIKEPPRDGEFTVRIKASVDRLPHRPRPVMKITYGHQAKGANAVNGVVGEVELDSDGSKVYTFRANARDFPNADELGDLWNQYLTVSNVFDDGTPAPKAVKVKGSKKKKTIPEEPEFPKIVIESVEFIGNDYSSWPPPAHRRIFFASKDGRSRDYVREVISRFLERAWRRPVADGEVSRYLAHYDSLKKNTDSPVAAVRETLAVALASTNFLYLVEPRTTEETRSLTEHELAARLSYFLWSSMPDEALRSHADRGELSKPETLRSEVVRMLDDPKSQRFVEQFTKQWLDLDGLERVAVNPQFYPDFNDDLKQDMAGETRAFFSEVLRKNESALQFLDADWTMVNADLARHYGIEGPKSRTFVRVSLKDGKRPGGLLGHAAMHLANSNGEDSHPIKRAVWIRERLLDDPPLPPPPNVPALDETNPDFAKLSIREQLEIHRNDPACADCHKGIDGWGIALDHFDAVGLWRDEIRRPSEKRGRFEHIAVDAKDNLPGGVEIDGLDQLKAYLLTDRRDQFARALAAKLYTYALGRSPEFADEPVLDGLAEQFSKDAYSLKSLITQIVTSDSFLTR